MKMRALMFAAIGIGMTALFADAVARDAPPSVIGFYTRDAAGQDLTLVGQPESPGSDTFVLSRGRGLHDDLFGGANWPQEPKARQDVGRARVSNAPDGTLIVEFIDLDLDELVPSPPPPTPPRVNRTITFSPLTS